MGPLPILLAAGALVLLSGRKKRRKPKAGKEPEHAPGGGAGSPTLPDGIVITSKPAYPKRRPKLGESCGSMTDKRNGIYSAYDENGGCVVFWKWGETDITMAQYIQEELNKLGISKKRACDQDVWEKDPFSASGGGRWVPNPTKHKVLKRALKRAYGQIPAERLPPGRSEPYYVKMVWKFADAVYMREICGYVPVT